MLKLYKPYICLYLDYRETLAPFTMEERGEIVTAMLNYANDGTETDHSNSNVRFIWPTIRSHIDRTADYQNHKAEIARINGQKGGRPPKKKTEENQQVFSETESVFEESLNNNSNNNSNSNSKSKSNNNSEFLPPTLDDVISFVKVNGLDIDPEKFCCYYSARGWLSAQNNPINWQLKAREWSESQLPLRKPEPAVSSPSRSYDMADIESFNVFTDWKH